MTLRWSSRARQSLSQMWRDSLWFLRRREDSTWEHRSCSIQSLSCHLGYRLHTLSVRRPGGTDRTRWWTSRGQRASSALRPNSLRRRARWLMRNRQVPCSRTSAHGQVTHAGYLAQGYIKGPGDVLYIKLNETLWMQGHLRTLAGSVSLQQASDANLFLPLKTKRYLPTKGRGQGWNQLFSGINQGYTSILCMRFIYKCL